MSAMEEGRNVLGEWMGEDVAVGVCQFWEGEWGVD